MIKKTIHEQNLHEKRIQTKKDSWLHKKPQLACEASDGKNRTLDEFEDDNREA